MRLPGIGVRIQAGRIGKEASVEPHLDVRLALLVSDHRRKEFESVEALRRMKGVRVGVGTYFAEKLQESFPNLVVVTLSSQREFFEKKGADVLLASAEGVLPEPCFIRLTVLSCQPLQRFSSL